MDGRARGIDVSHNDNDGNPIMWSSVGPFGIDFVIMKASEGAGFTDPQFHNNWPGVKAAGLVRGAYHMIGFVDPTTNSAWRDVVHRQVDRFLGIVGPPQSGDLPPALDIEDLNSPAGWKNLIQKDRSSALAVVREYITYTTSQLNGINPILYTGSFWWSELADPDPGTMPFSVYPLWFAQYPLAVPGPTPGSPSQELHNFQQYASLLDGKQPTHIPKVWGGPASPRWVIWQFSEQGAMSNFVTGNVDLDVFHGTAADLQQLCIK